MENANSLFKLISEIYIENSIKKIKEIERKRNSLPNVNLTDIEFEILIGISQGRKKDELEKALSLYSKRTVSYNSVVHSLFKKFEAVTLAQVIYKAMKTGIIN